MPPAEPGAENATPTMSLKALVWRGPITICKPRSTVGQAPVKQRYVASSEIVASYDVLKTRTSEKKGAAPTIDAAVGSVIRLGSSSAIA